MTITAQHEIVCQAQPRTPADDARASRRGDAPTWPRAWRWVGLEQYDVPSFTGRLDDDGYPAVYTVDLLMRTCTCPGFTSGSRPFDGCCKHLLALRCLRAAVDAGGTVVVAAPVMTRGVCRVCDAAHRPLRDGLCGFCAIADGVAP